jgi:hypothetical protein
VGAGAVDIAKTLHWDLGEQTFRLQDWQLGWKIDQQLQGWQFNGIVCDTTKPFTLDAALPDSDIAGKYAITPTGDGPIAYSFDGTFGQFALTATGTGNIQTPQNAEPVVHLGKPAHVQMAALGNAIDLGSIFLDSGDLVLIPLETEECSSGS